MWKGLWTVRKRPSKGGSKSKRWWFWDAETTKVTVGSMCLKVWPFPQPPATWQLTSFGPKIGCNWANGAEVPLRHTVGGTWRSAIWMTLCMVSEVFWLSLLRLVLGGKANRSFMKTKMRWKLLRSWEYHQSEMRSYRIRAWFAQFPAGQATSSFLFNFELCNPHFFGWDWEEG